MLPAGKIKLNFHLRLPSRQIVRRLIIALAVAAIAAVSQTKIAATLRYFSDAIAGRADPFWPHAILLGISVVAGAVVAAGIVYEADEYKEHPLHRVAKWFVIWGVVVESFCTISLFVFDEGISNAQQSKIIALETKLAPRTLTDAQVKRVGDKLSGFAGQEYGIVPYWDMKESFDIANRVQQSLQLAHWVFIPPPTTGIALFGGIVGICRISSDWTPLISSEWDHPISG